MTPQTPTLVKEIKSLLAARQKTIGTVESITGGGVAYALTSIAGSSAYFTGSIVSYAKEIKQNLLGVRTEIFSHAGIYSEAMAIAMAERGLVLLECDLCVALTGVAGPGAGLGAPATGSVFIAIAGSAKTRSKKLLLHGGDRESIRNQAIDEALKLIIENGDYVCSSTS